jgi:uncharacterized protein with von Willebrand factor type A (vWA) domain
VTPAAGDAVLSMLLVLFEQLRAAGVGVSMSEVLDAADAMRHLDLLDRELLREALAASLIKRHQDRAVFDELFDRCFGVAAPAAAKAPVAAQAATTAGDPSGAAESTGSGDLLAALRAGDVDRQRAVVLAAIDQCGIGTGEGSERSFVYRVVRALDLAGLLAAVMRAERAGAPDASALELRLRRDEVARQLDDLRRLIEAEVRRRRRWTPSVPAPALRPPDDLDVFRATTVDRRAMRAAVRPLARQLARRVAQRRRWQRRGRLDVRRTMRRSLGSGGVPLDPSFRRRRASKADVVVLCDLSGSVAEFAEFTLTLVHALHHELSRLRSFVFVDGVAEVTDLIERAEQFPEPHHLLRRPGVVADDGHSDYGRAFECFWTVHAGTVLTPRTTLIVTGDARTNFRSGGLEPFRLMADRARRTYWLNPEPRAEWDRGDSRIGEYARYCAEVFEVRSLRQLADAVVAIV